MKGGWNLSKLNFGGYESPDNCGNERCWTGLQGLIKGQWVHVWQVLRVLEKIHLERKTRANLLKKPYMIIDVYRLYSEGSGELFESFIWDLLSLFKKQLWVIWDSWGGGLQTYCASVCRYLWGVMDCMMGDDKNAPCIVLVCCRKDGETLSIWLDSFPYLYIQQIWVSVPGSVPWGSRCKLQFHPSRSL